MNNYQYYRTCIAIRSHVPDHAGHGHLCVILKMYGGVTGDEAIASYKCVSTHTTDTNSYKFR